MEILSNLGEKTIIQQILKVLKDSPRNLLGRTDDSAIYDLGFEKYLVSSTDRIPVPYGLTLGLLNFEGMGKYFACSSLNDVIAKGASPFAMLISLGIPRNMRLRRLISFCQGISKIIEKYGVTVIGGDTKPTRSFDIVGTVLGLIDKGYLISRKGASPGDVVAITGEIGLFTAYTFAEQRLGKKNRKLLSNLKNVYNRQLDIPFDLMDTILRIKSATASIDISDGLYGDLSKIGKLSGVGMEIDVNRIPFPNVVQDIAKELDVSTEIFATFGGDLQIALTFDGKKWEKTIQEIEKKGLNLYPIGRVVRGSGIRLFKNGKSCKLGKVIEWDLFSRLSLIEKLSLFEKQLNWT